MAYLLRRNCALGVVVAGLLLTGCGGGGAKGHGQQNDPSRRYALNNSPPRPVVTYSPAQPRKAGVTQLTQARANSNPAMGTTRQLRDIRVMSFNVRVAVFIDGPNHWDFRKGLLLRTIRDFNPDLLGTQECNLGQSNYLRQQLPDYEFVGIGRADGKFRGEMCGVFFKRSRFDKLEEGHFWLSESPQRPGSKSWGTANTRMVTWVKLRDQSDGSALCLFNTHFDHRGKFAREQSAKLLRQKIDAIAGTLPVIITGDFNVDENSPPYRTMIAGTRPGSERFIDTFRAAHPPGNRYADSHDGTRHSFRGSLSGPRIDWILTDSQFRTVSASIDHTSAGARYPSDHFPVTAVVRPLTALPVARVE